MRAADSIFIVASIALFSCATTAPQVNSYAVGCQRDTQCKADRICEKNRCVYPASSTVAKGDTFVATSKSAEKKKIEVSKTSTEGDPIACEQGDAIQCYNLGMAKAFGVGVSKDEGDARAYFQKACRGGHIFGCINLLFLLEKRNGAKEAGAKSEYQKLLDVEAFGKSCESEDVDACFIAARLSDHSLLEDVEKDLVKAREFYTKACDMEHAASCAFVAKMHKAGLGGPKDAAKANEYQKKACDLGDETSCKVGKKGKKKK